MWGRALIKDLASAAGSKLARRFASYTIGLSIVIALGISLMWVYSSYNRIFSDLNKELDQIEHSIKNTLTIQLWQMNLKGLRIIIDDLLLNKNIVYAKLVDEKGKTLIERGRLPSGKGIVRSVPLYYHQANGKRIYLGKLVYVATIEALLTNFRYYFFKTLISWLFFFLFLGAAIQLIYWLTTARHLIAIKDYASRIRLGGYGRDVGQLRLNRSVGSGDELDELVASINEMHREIVDQFATIEYQSLHDALTGLPNRRMIERLVEQAIGDCRVDNGFRALLSIDLDNFKLLNESLGHAAGDEILREVANRLRTISGSKFQPARVSGDHFLLLQNETVPDYHTAKETAEAFAKKLLSSLSEGMTVDGRDIKLSASVGIALLGPESRPDTVLKQADIALHHAMSQGRGRIVLFNPVMQRMTDRQLYLDHLISNAVAEDLLYMDYQPKFCGPGRICSAEALARLRDGKGGFVPPREFIPVLEQTGAIVEIGDHLIKLVFRFINKHQKEIERAGLDSMAINVSPVQFSSAGFADRMIDLARRYDIPPKFIIFEITEEVVVGNIEHVIDVMKRLTSRGFRFSIDDFGTGYSSFRYLIDLPLAELKIDRSLVKDITTDSRARAIVATIIDMAHNFSLEVVAEGVETKEQFEYLRKHGCDQYQGFFFSPPLSAQDFLALLQPGGAERNG